MSVCEAAPFTQERLLSLFTRAPGAFWRFDVDVSLAAAVKMARLAHLAGVIGTFYVMLRSEFYNPFARSGQVALQQIELWGHTLGLHVDCRAAESPEDAVIGDQDLLEYSGLHGMVDGRRISFHMPPPSVLWRDFDGFDSAYGSEWDGRYLSDARREFGLDKEVLVADCYQIALHAEHWFPCA